MEDVKITAEKQEHTALLWTIIDEPLLIRRLLQYKKELIGDFVQYSLTHTVKRVYFNGQASGTFIRNMLAPRMEKLLQVEAEMCNPTSFPEYLQFSINRQHSPDKMLMLHLAHSGVAAGPIRMAQGCKRLNIPVVCITIDSNSPLVNFSDVVINKLCGSKESFIEARTHMVPLLITSPCIIETISQEEFINKRQYTYYQQYFARLEDDANQIIKDTADRYRNHRELLQMKMVARYTGASPYYAIAQGGGLKIAGAASIATLAYGQKGSIHTGTAQIQKGTLLSLIVPNGVQKMQMLELIRWCRLYNDYVVLITNHSHPLKDSEALLRHFQDDPCYSVMEHTVPFQMPAHLLAEDRGLSVVHVANDGTSAYLRAYTEEI